MSTSPALTVCPSSTRMARTTPVSSGWMTLVRPLGTIFPVAEATMSMVPQAGPAQRGAEQQDDDRRDGAADRRWRRLHDLERGRQERQLFGAPLRRTPKRNNPSHRLAGHGGFSGLHEFLPAADAAMHSGRLS